MHLRTSIPQDRPATHHPGMSMLTPNHLSFLVSLTRVPLRHGIRPERVVNTKSCSGLSSHLSVSLFLSYVLWWLAPQVMVDQVHYTTCTPGLIDRPWQVHIHTLWLDHITIPLFQRKISHSEPNKKDLKGQTIDALAILIKVFLNISKLTDTPFMVVVNGKGTITDAVRDLMMHSFSSFILHSHPSSPPSPLLISVYPSWTIAHTLLQAVDGHIPQAVYTCL